MPRAPVPTEVLQKIVALIKESPQDVTVATLPAAYKRKWGLPLSAADLGLKKLSDVLKQADLKSQVYVDNCGTKAVIRMVGTPPGTRVKRDPAANPKNRSPKDSGACHVCGQVGHMKRDCPQRPQAAEPEQADGGGGGKGGLAKKKGKKKTAATGQKGLSAQGSAKRPPPAKVPVGGYVICKFFANASADGAGFCQKGAKCTFAHGEAELAGWNSLMGTDSPMPKSPKSPRSPKKQVANKVAVSNQLPSGGEQALPTSVLQFFQHFSAGETDTDGVPAPAPTFNDGAGQTEVAPRQQPSVLGDSVQQVDQGREKHERQRAQQLVKKQPEEKAQRALQEEKKREEAAARRKQAAEEAKRKRQQALDGKYLKKLNEARASGSVIRMQKVLSEQHKSVGVAVSAKRQLLQESVDQLVASAVEEMESALASEELPRIYAASIKYAMYPGGAAAACKLLFQHIAKLKSELRALHNCTDYVVVDSTINQYLAVDPRVLGIELKDAKQRRSDMLDKCTRDLCGMANAKKQFSSKQIASKLDEFATFPSRGAIGDARKTLEAMLKAKRIAEEKARQVAAEKRKKELAEKRKAEEAETARLAEEQFWAAQDEAK